MLLILVSLCGLISYVSQHKHLLVHLSCHSITKTKQGPFTEEGEDDGIAPNDADDMISKDEATTNTSDVNDADREARRARNRARAIRRRRVNERMRSMHCELDAEFAAVSERGFRTPVANILFLR
jgi:hypothetical protein